MPDETDVLQGRERVTAMPKVNTNPVQRPGGHKLVRSARLGGPAEPGDRRLYLHASHLGRLLDIARSSPTMQVEMRKVGLRVDLYEDEHGHRYEVWAFESVEPRPEQPPDGVAAFFERGG